MNKEELIEKWLNSDLNEAENEAFKQLDEYQLNVDIIENAQHFKASKFSQIDEFSSFKDKFESQNTPVKKINWLHPLLRIASVLVVSFGIYFTFFYNNLTQIETLASEKTTIELPDRSQVTLNARSNIEYSQRKWDDKRSLKLNGEAFFKVAKGKQFDVITSDGIVTVVGTEFNVKQRDNYFEVICYEGIVRVSSDTIVKQLVAGDTYEIIKGRFMEGKTKTLEPLWTKNISSFEGISFDEVIFELERQYNIKVSLKNVNVDRLFSGGFTHNNLDEALISITQPMNLTYELNSSNRVIIYGQKK